MTLAEIEKLDRDYLTVVEVASCLHYDAQVVRDQVERNPKWLGFNICQCGKSIKIPRLAFIAWMKGEIPMLVYDQSVHQLGYQSSSALMRT